MSAMNIGYSAKHCDIGKASLDVASSQKLCWPTRHNNHDPMWCWVAFRRSGMESQTVQAGMFEQVHMTTTMA